MPNPHKALFTACKNNDVDTVKSLIDRHPNINVNKQFYYDNDEYYGHNTLSLSCTYGYIRIVELLLTIKYIQLNKLFEEFGNEQPFTMAYKNGHNDITIMLLHSEKFNPNFKINSTLLIDACNAGDDKLVALLLSSNKTDVNLFCKKSNQHYNINIPIIVAYENGYMNIVNMLMNHSSFNINYKYPHHDALLKYACDRGMTDFINLLLTYAKSHSLVIKYDDVYASINDVCKNGREDIFDLLIQYTNIDLNSYSSWSSPLDHACFGGHHGIIKKLLVFGVTGVITKDSNDTDNEIEDIDIIDDDEEIEDITEQIDNEFYNQINPETLKLINEYKQNKNIIKKWECEIKMKNREAMITPIVLVSDGYYIIKQNVNDQHTDSDKQDNMNNMNNIIRFFTITKDLPQELQILIVSLMFEVRKYGLNGDLVTEYCKKIIKNKPI